MEGEDSIEVLPFTERDTGFVVEYPCDMCGEDTPLGWAYVEATEKGKDPSEMTFHMCHYCVDPRSYDNSDELGSVSAILRAVRSDPPVIRSASFLFYETIVPEGEDASVSVPILVDDALVSALYADAVESPKRKWTCDPLTPKSRRRAHKKKRKQRHSKRLRHE
jgi:hypothetical protein